MLPTWTEARPRATVKHQSIRSENPHNGKEKLILPYAFASEDWGVVFGVGGGAKGYIQDQLIMGGTGFWGAEDVYGAVLGAWDYRPFGMRRFFVSAAGSYGHYPNQRAYFSLAYDPDGPRRGSNDSDKDDFVETPGESNWYEVKFEYVLPIGVARSDGIINYRLQGGMLQGRGSGGRSWNPLAGGVTILMVRPYGQLESYETRFGKFERPVYPVEFGIAHNNTDYPPNPSRGSSQSFSVKRDWGWGDAEFPWTFWKFEASKYFDFGRHHWVKQQVLAFNLWTGDTPTWAESLDTNGNVVVSDRPPQREGASLGGMYRMRAYPTGRFNDRSVIYTTAEFRFTPHWNPIGETSWLRWLKMDWWQFVGFVETGRVANTYSLDALSKDWKIDGGLGIRAMMAGGVVRLDWAISDEGSNLWVMFGHPF